MRSFKAYINKILNHIDAPQNVKEELAHEFMDHLLQIKRDKIESGYSEEKAIQLAKKEFGQSSELAPMLQKSITPFRIFGKVMTWILFGMYFTLLIYWFSNSISNYGMHDFNPFDDVKYLMLHPINVMAVIVGYGALSVFLAILFKSMRKFTLNLTMSILIIQLINTPYYVLHIRSFTMSGFIDQLGGFIIGFLIWSVVNYLSVILKRNRANKSDEQMKSD
ncbi:hypothetical protein IC620_01255 [Hazenella sp. IB182357]|uniref:Uncharacterized protein n=1 Tax=Polycladospora coralii TaxID=2771432 RepID=A0A926N8W7_9BACL|nr:permease prefix domain 1-containing protein [Polycladospora coralii]MBD1370990.1 hypothetical protein [Polycladospora coralii]MBS7529929.1 hypothetical protein [Polycladospora coralii]